MKYKIICNLFGDANDQINIIYENYKNNESLLDGGYQGFSLT